MERKLHRCQMTGGQTNRIELDKEYTLQKVSDLMLLTHVSELSELECMAETFAAEIIDSDNDFEPPSTSAGGGGQVGNGRVQENWQVRSRGILCWSWCWMMSKEVAHRRWVMAKEVTVQLCSKQSAAQQEKRW